MISKRAQSIAPSATLQINAQAKELASKGFDIISFAAGEPDFDTPENIKNAARKAIDDGFTKYTATSGTLELKQAICDKFRQDNGLSYDPKNILVGNGAKQCLYNIFQTILDPDDEVIVPVPYWVSYEEMVKLAGGECVFVNLTNKSSDRTFSGHPERFSGHSEQSEESQRKFTPNNFLLSPDDLKRVLTPKTKALIINSPSNPTGAV